MFFCSEIKRKTSFHDAKRNTMNVRLILVLTLSQKHHPLNKGMNLSAYFIQLGGIKPNCVLFTIHQIILYIFLQK
jgi:hypothetical protein